jgi:phosphosulfolactate phosphohydrolase-like enzyme
MRAVAERLVCGIPAATKRDHRATCKAETVSGCVLNHDVVAGYAKRAVVDAIYCCIICITHQSSPLDEFLTSHCIARAARIESESKINGAVEIIRVYL